ncbi:Fungalysin metallopeptidase-domain-containing protein [Mycena vitilis]|nr:Fungalysin metallopeptidase-domain-containing protein [Mycena vitilis]
MLSILVSLALLLGGTQLVTASTDPPVHTVAPGASPWGTYLPPSTYQTFSSGGIGLPFVRRDANLAATAASFVASHLKVNATMVNFKSGYSANGTEYAYLSQQHNNIPFANAVANVAIKNGKVVSFGSSFVEAGTIANSTPAVPVRTAILAAETALNATYNQIPTLLEYFVHPDHSVSLVHVIQVRNDGDWHETFVDAHSGKFVGSINLFASSVFLAVPWNQPNPTVAGFKKFDNPADYDASLGGWDYNGSQNGMAAFTFDTSYGFTDAAFNFQNTNVRYPQGLGNDAVKASCQDRVEAWRGPRFGTPPDGQSPDMLLPFTGGADPGFANDIIAHEFTHGVTNRMTGGGTARCLRRSESLALGEGWSDALAEWTEQLGPTIGDYELAKYVNHGAGIRSYPYSTNLSVNPWMYAHAGNALEQHAGGEIWATILHCVHSALVETHGFNTDAPHKPEGLEGNVVFLHLFIDGLALQPCNPIMINARDAFIQADQNRYGGTHRCVLWRAFASRGMGAKANTGYTNDFAVPGGC